jgi:tRNA uridine 5-carbamoylmethylation protein Kti12
MAMSFGSVDYGRNQKAINKLVTQMEQKVNAILKNVNVESKEYKAIESAIKNCWVGVDADNFLKQMKTRNQNAYNNIKNTKKEFVSLFQENEDAFAKFQKSNRIM